MELDQAQTEFTQSQINGLIAGSMLSSGSYQYSSRRERISSHLLAAMIVGGSHGHTSLGFDVIADNLVERALSLTDKLIIQLEKDKYFPVKEEVES